MYKVKLDNYNKKLEKAIKGLKKKNDYSLREAESLLQQLHEKSPESINLIVRILDYEADKAYEFDKCIIDPDGSSPNLIEMLQEELLSQDNFDKSFINKLLNNLEKQYAEEPIPAQANSSSEPRKKGFNLGKFMPAKKEGNQPFESTFETPKKGISIFKKNTQKETLEKTMQATPIMNDFENDFAELDTLMEDDLENEEHTDTLEHTVEEVDYNDPEDSEEENQEEENMSNESIDVLSENHGYREEAEPEEEPEPEHQVNPKNIYFPEYDKFLDMSTVENIIQRQNNRLEKEHLVKFLGLNALSNDTVLTELDTLKLNYALNSLEESKFMLIRDYFNTSVQNIKDKTQNGLAQIYEQVMTFDYQEEAKKTLNEELESVKKETESEFAHYLSGQEEEHNQKLTKFKLEQKKTLEDFIRQQEFEYNQFVQDLDTKKEARLNVYKDDMQRKLNNIRKQMLDEKEVELKYNSINSMIEAKRRSIRSFEAELDNAVDDTWEKTQEAIASLKQEIEAHIPTWKNEIEEKRKLEAEQREEARKEETLELERKRIEVQLKQLEFSKNRKVEEEESKIAELLERRFSLYDSKIAEALQNVSTPKEVVAVAEQPNKLSVSKPNILKKYFTASAIVLLALGGGAIASTVINQEPKAHAQEQEEVSEYARLTQTIEALEQKLAVKEEGVTEESQPSLDNLLLEKNYEKAMSLYKDQDSLLAIEEALYRNKDLAYLITFNKTSETPFGKLDEALLSKNDKEVLENYQSLPDDVKGSLSEERKNDIALSLYHLDQNDLANQLLAKGEKE